MKGTLLESDARRPARAVHWGGRGGPRLATLIMRIPVEHAEAMRAMSQKTRVPIAEYQREAIEDWLKKHDALPVAPGDEGDTRGGA